MNAGRGTGAARIADMNAGRCSRGPDGRRAMIGGVIPRYALPEMAAVFSDVGRLRRWLEIELLATEAWARVGVVPSEAAAACRESAPTVDAAFVEACAERERVTDHDLAAFVDVVQRAIAARAGEGAAKWIHFGLTSSDVVD